MSEEKVVKPIKQEIIKTLLTKNIKSYFEGKKCFIEVDLKKIDQFPKTDIVAYCGANITDKNIIQIKVKNLDIVSKIIEDTPKEAITPNLSAGIEKSVLLIEINLEKPQKTANPEVISTTSGWVPINKNIELFLVVYEPGRIKEEVVKK